MGEINPVEAVLSNTDLLIQILTRVSPKPLITFQIVSKHWLSLISDPHFIVTQTRHHLTTRPASSLSLFHYRNTSISIRSGEDHTRISPKLDCLKDLQQNDPFGSQLNILSSCNGLVLCQYRYHNPYIVFNPTTQKHRLLPDPLSSLGYKRRIGTVLAFDPLKSFHYKIIRFRSVHFPEPAVDIDIFSSESGEWKELHRQDPPGGVVCFTRMIFWNGAIHLMAKPNFHVRFIIDDEKFIWDRIPTNPETFPERGDFGYFGKSDTGLLVIKFSSGKSFHGWTTEDGADEVFTVLEMDKDSCWFPKHQVDLKPLVSKHPEMNLVLENGGRRLKYSVLYVKSGDKSEDFTMVLAIAKKIVLYDVRKGNGDTDSKVLCEFPYDSSYRDTHPFIECLAPVL